MTGCTNIRGRVARMIRLAANDELPPGWLCLPEGEITADTECVLLVDAETDDPDDLENTAEALGFPVPGLETDDLKSIFDGAQYLIANPSDSVLVRAFNYYLEFDAYLPSIDAPDPPSPEKVLDAQDRQFYQSLGAEREGTLCRKAGCERGSVALSVFCRTHHFESVKKRPCPFHD